MTIRGSRWLNSGLLIAVNIMWAVQYPAYKIVGESMAPAALNFWTLVLAAVLLLPFLWRTRNQSVTRWRRVTPRDVLDFVLLGVLGIIPPSVLLAWGIEHSSASNASILSLTIPVLMIVLGAVFLGEHFTAIRAVSIILGLTGTLLVSINDMRTVSFAKELLLGNMVVLLAAGGSAFYNVYSKALLRRFTEIEVLFGSYTVGALACAVISVAFEAENLFSVTRFDAKTWVAVAALGFLSWGAAMIIWMWVLNRLDVGQIAVSIYFLPFFGLLLSVLTLHEHLRGVQIIGGLIVFAATLALTLYDKSQAKMEDAACTTSLS